MFIYFSDIKFQRFELQLLAHGEGMDSINYRDVKRDDELPCYRRIVNYLKTYNLK